MQAIHKRISALLKVGGGSAGTEGFRYWYNTLWSNVKSKELVEDWC